MLLLVLILKIWVQLKDPLRRQQHETDQLTRSIEVVSRSYPTSEVRHDRLVETRKDTGVCRVDYGPPTEY